MLTGLDQSELLAENLVASEARPSDAVLCELTHLGLSHDELAFLATELFEHLRKLSGQSASLDCLGGIQYLAAQGTVAGARLLAAFLNVAPPGDRLLPLVRGLDSCRRYTAQIQQASGSRGPRQSDWQRRMGQVVATCAALAAAPPTATGSTHVSPRRQQPWAMLRSVLARLLEQGRQEEFWSSATDPDLLAEMLRLEVDAWQERISGLAGNINPFRVSSVARVLPLLNRADADIRDLRQIVAWVSERDYESAFIRPQARWRETLDDKDWGRVLKDLDSRVELAGLGRLARGLATRPIMLPQLAEGARRIIDLSAALVADGVRDTPLDLLTACVLAQSHFGNGQVVLTVDKDVAEAVAGVLPDRPGRDHPLRGISLLSGLLIFELNDNPPELTHGLPVVRDFSADEESALLAWRVENHLVDPRDLEQMDAETLAAPGAEDAGPVVPEEDGDEDIGASALKHLVMTNLQSTSVLLGFLRNPKITSIPGLVEEVAVRTRNPQVIATIASDRTLYSGFANKGVALACLRSPCNVSIKTLRKFCHVKYVSKVELKRMAADRAGIRKEIAREIAAYLESLA